MNKVQSQVQPDVCMCFKRELYGRFHALITFSLGLTGDKARAFIRSLVRRPYLIRNTCSIISLFMSDVVSVTVGPYFRILPGEILIY